MFSHRFQDVYKKCTEGRFFSYENWHDKIFFLPAIVLVWFFVNLGWSGNSVSWLSGMVTILGGISLASGNKFYTLLGSLSYLLFYLLDYVDGGVARYRGDSGISGQYIDWVMHVISAISIALGIFIGAINHSGDWIVIFGIPFIVASALQLDRFSLGWFSIAMYCQQNRVKGVANSEWDLSVRGRVGKIENLSLGYRFFKIVSVILFHENYAIIILPFLAILNYFFQYLNLILPDFRVVLTIIGGVVYFPMMVLDISKIVHEKKLEMAYIKLFLTKETPTLPDDHFFK